MLAGNKGFAKLAISAQLTLGEYLNYVVVLFFFSFFSPRCPLVCVVALYRSRYFLQKMHSSIIILCVLKQNQGLQFGGCIWAVVY